ncbi:Peptide methionine sulfoxide reductase MsrB [hydrothermal vent metagenome]|uniref:peptide-methionine (S)-S-oxide reductase n=1 Tax=hydrothermal vent metagenome TaxID=652676 RepID=A0A1W1D5L5_9ZZZZ
MKELNEFEQYVILQKGTEMAFSGEYYDFYEDGLYVCKQCSTPLFQSSAKFNSGTGWPSFDDSIAHNVKEVPDKDGRRTEIVCANCGGHLGHVFFGEQFTPKNTRHCVNSISLQFIPKTKFPQAYFAGGCFWGVEYFFEQVEGVVCAVSGYMGGEEKNPTYEMVCSKTTNHIETVEVSYDPNKVDFTSLAKLFFEIHDPTQKDGQGPDIGPQYQSAIFYNNEKEKEIAQQLIKQLQDKGYDVVTKLIDANMHPFYKAEAYHQDYYAKKGTIPYCHKFIQKF